VFRSFLHSEGKPKQPRLVEVSHMSVKVIQQIELIELVCHRRTGTVPRRAGLREENVAATPALGG